MSPTTLAFQLAALGQQRRAPCEGDVSGSKPQVQRFPPKDVQLGQLTQQLLVDAKWLGTDQFPAWQVWADDVEEVLTFLQRESRLEAFFSVVRAAQTPQHRDACLAEARGAFHLNRNGFRIIQWEPRGEGHTKGEVLVSLPDSPDIFVEIKQPGWQGEQIPRRVAERETLSKEDRERRFARIKQEKHLDMEGGAVGSHLVALDVVRRNALPKLTDRCPNLVIVIDDLRVTPVGLPSLTTFVEREFTRPDHDPDDPEDVFTYERLGGLLFLQPEADNDQSIKYRADFVQNVNAIPTCALPPTANSLFVQMREESRRNREEQFAGRPSVFDILRSRDNSDGPPWGTFPRPRGRRTI
jgi:hypothetical protein